MAEERRPFTGFARPGVAPGEARGAALLDTAAVRVARVNHVGGETGSTQLPVVTAEAAAAILNAATPITSSLPRVEAVQAPSAVSPVERAAHAPFEAGLPAVPAPVVHEAAPAPLVQEQEPPHAVSAPPVLASETSEPRPSVPVVDVAADAGEVPSLEDPHQAPAAAAEPTPESVGAAETSEAPVAAVQSPLAEAPPLSRRPAHISGTAARVSSSAGEFEAFAETAIAAAPPTSRTPLGVDPELTDDPEAGTPDLEPDETLPTGVGAPVQEPTPQTPVDESVVVLEEPVLISGGEIIRPRTMQAPAAPQAAPTTGLTPTADARDDLARAADPAVQGQELMGLATHRRAAVRAAVAARPDLPATVVVFLSRDHSSEVLTSLLRNVRVPASTVRYLADHRDPRVADLAVQRLRNDFR